MLSLGAKSDTIVFRNYLETSITIEETDPLVYSATCTEEVIAETWSDIMKGNLKPDCTKILKEEDLDNQFNEILSYIVEKHNLKIRVHRQNALLPTPFRPDIQLTDSNITLCTAKDARVVVELENLSSKKENKDKVGMGQAISYLATATNLRLQDEESFDKFQPTIAFYCNLMSFAIAYMLPGGPSDSGNKHFITPFMRFMVNDDRKNCSDAQPTDGFKSFLRMLFKISETSCAPETVTVDGNTFVVQSHLSSSFSLKVILTELNGREVVVKYAVNPQRNKHGWSMVSKEYHFIKQLSKISGLNLLNVEYSTSTALIMYPYCNPVSVVLGERSGISEEKTLLIVNKCIEQVDILHQNGFVHGDLRPSNILVELADSGEVKVYLIDWETSGRIGSIACTVNGRDDFASDDFYEMEFDQKKSVLLEEKHDLETLAYSLTLCVELGNSVPWKTLSERAKYMRKLGNETCNIKQTIYRLYCRAKSINM